MIKKLNKGFYKHPNFTLFFFYLLLTFKNGSRSWLVWGVLLMTVLLCLNLWVALTAKAGTPSRHWWLLPLLLGLLLLIDSV